MSHSPHMLWIDNFSKTYTRKVPSLSNADSVYHDCLWTGVAMRKVDLEDQHLNLEVQYDQQGQLIPAMPEAITNEERIAKIMAWIQYVDEEGMELYDQCCSKDILTIPLTPDKEDAMNIQDYRESIDGMANLYPVELIEKNIGSNVGLLSIINEMLNEMDTHRPARYVIVLCDINIFERILRVIAYIHMA